jgi:hypothetical protein
MVSTPARVIARRQETADTFTIGVRDRRGADFHQR